MPGVPCSGFRLAYEASGCRGAADRIEGRGENVPLPFRESFSSCQVAAEQNYPRRRLLRGRGIYGEISDVGNFKYCFFRMSISKVLCLVASSRRRLL